MAHRSGLPSVGSWGRKGVTPWPCSPTLSEPGCVLQPGHPGPHWSGDGLVQEARVELRTRRPRRRGGVRDRDPRVRRPPCSPRSSRWTDGGPGPRRRLPAHPERHGAPAVPERDSGRAAQAGEQGTGAGLREARAAALRTPGRSWGVHHARPDLGLERCSWTEREILAKRRAAGTRLRREEEALRLRREAVLGLQRTGGRGRHRLRDGRGPGSGGVHGCVGPWRDRRRVFGGIGHGPLEGVLSLSPTGTIRDYPDPSEGSEPDTPRRSGGGSPGSEPGAPERGSGRTVTEPAAPATVPRRRPTE